MSSRPLQRPIRFTPAEISASVNMDVVMQHAEEAAFLWNVRSRATAAPHFSLKDLAILDGRIEAHLDGLRVAAKVGLRVCQRNLVNGDIGELFGFAVLAFGAGERDLMRDALNLGCASAAARPGLISASGWLEYGRVSPWLRMLLNAHSPLHRSVGIAAYAVHRQDPGSILKFSVSNEDALLRARALRAVGELKRYDLIDDVREHLNDQHEECRFWAAWSLALLGGHDAHPPLLRFAESDGTYASRALRVVLRAMSLADSRRWLSWLATQTDRARLSVLGAAIIGDPTSVPWLIKKMEAPALARIAGEAFSTITGVDLAYHDLNQGPPEKPEGDSDDAAGDEIVLDDEDVDLPWPSPPLIAKWWERNHARFASGVRYLNGEPISAKSAVVVLAQGSQRLRAAAALELALSEPTRLYWEIRARGDWQEKRLAAWSS